MKDERPVVRAKPVQPKRNFTVPIIVGVCLAGSAILVSGFLFVAHQLNRMDREQDEKNAAESLTGPVSSDGDLIAWKDNPEMFKGRTFKVEARYYQEAPIRGIATKRVKFILSPWNRSNRSSVEIDIVVDLSEIKTEMPNLTHYEKAMLVFDCTEGSFSSGNIAKSISR